MARRYRLRFESQDVGEIVEESAEFPSLYGRWQAPAKALSAQLEAYVAYSREQDRVGVASGYGDAWEQFIAEHEARFLDLIESNEWSVEDEAGTRESICVPIFTSDGGVVWRWRVSGDGE